MSTSGTKNRKQTFKGASQTKRRSNSVRWIAALAAVLVIGGIAAVLLANKSTTRPASMPAAAPATSNTPPAMPTQAPPAQPASNDPMPELMKLDVATAVMVTDELDFGPRPPSIAEALREIERRYQPDDGVGRTFAVLDAYGEPTPDGKLHISMHVSTEKPGGAQLIFRRTGRVLFRARINPTSQPPATKSLTVLIDNGGGKMWTVDGSTNPSSVLTATAKEVGKPIQDIWADGTEREVTFIYSACGCPVKVMVKRVGDRTVRTKDTPVIFPDDPAAVKVISQLMRW
jgi:hypothetical protein